MSCSSTQRSATDTSFKKSSIYELTKAVALKYNYIMHGGSVAECKSYDTPTFKKLLTIEYLAKEPTILFSIWSSIGKQKYSANNFLS